MSKCYIAESKTDQGKEGYKNLCRIYLPVNQLTEAGQDNEKYRFSFHRIGTAGYMYSYVYAANAEELIEKLKPFSKKIIVKKKEGRCWRLYLDYNTGEVFSDKSPKSHKICISRKVYKQLPVRLGNYAIDEASKKLRPGKNCLLQMVVRTAIWAPDQAYHAQKDSELVHVRKRPSDSRKKGTCDENGHILDDNSYPNRCIKAALKNYLGYTVAQNEYNVCHIWDEFTNGDKTCYDPRYFANLGNLVLVPKALASLTDYLPQVKNALKVRAYQLFKLIPEGESISQSEPDIRASDWLTLESIK